MMNPTDERSGLSGDPGSTEVQAEAQDNVARAAQLDATFADLWAQHLRAACVEATREHQGEAGLFEACRRAFREGYHCGAYDHARPGHERAGPAAQA